ncbi:MAG: maleylpyruvate isomerase N-terminal domain-containing protein, partial [Blastocatellia bacterium]
MEGQVQSLGPVFTSHLFSKLETLLIDLLLGLAPSDWQIQTVAPKWRVKDVAAHLLDTALRNLSFGRDGDVADAPVINSNADLVAFIDRLNEDGVRMYGRLSPPVLISLIEVASRQCSDYHLSLDPFATARFGVSWAGEDKSFNWFDIARE